MSKFIEVSAVLETEKNAGMGIEDFIFCPTLIDITRIEYIKPSFDKDGKEEPFTFIHLYSGQAVCVKLVFQEVAKIIKENKLQLVWEN